MKSKAAETISTNFTGQGRQAVTYRETLELRVQEVKHKLRIIIKSDSYTFQCGARIERWDGAKWHQVHYIGGDAMKTKLAYSKDPQTNDVRLDRKELLRVATAVLS